MPYQNDKNKKQKLPFSMLLLSGLPTKENIDNFLYDYCDLIMCVFCPVMLFVVLPMRVYRAHQTYDIFPGPIESFDRFKNFVSGLIWKSDSGEVTEELREELSRVRIPTSCRGQLAKDASSGTAAVPSITTSAPLPVAPVASSTLPNPSPVPNRSDNSGMYPEFTGS